MKLKQDIQKRWDEFSDLCQTYRVKILYAFGSSVTGRFNEETSDIDLLIDLMLMIRLSEVKN